MNTPQTAERNNLLNFPGLRRLVMSKGFPIVLQVAGVAVYMMVIVLGISGLDESTRYTNFGSFVIWVIWWPAVVFLGLIGSRLWCTVCPLGFIASRLDHYGLNLKIPGVLRKHKLAILIGMFLLHSLVVSFEINHTGLSTALYLLMLVGYAVIAAIIFEPASFCNHLCPLVSVIGTYSHISPTELRASEKTICNDCSQKSCFHNCRSNIYLGNLTENSSCVLCFDCVKNCPNKNVQYSWRQTLSGLWREKKDRLAYSLFTILLLGIMIEEVGEEWEVLHSATTYVPDLLTGMGISGTLLGYNWLSAVWINFLLPFAIVGASALAARLIWKQRSFWENLETYTLAFVPLIFCLHLTKMWFKFNGKLGFSAFILADPGGANTAALISQKLLPTPGYIIGDQASNGIFLLLVVVLGLVTSMIALTKIAERQRTPEAKLSAFPFYLTIGATGLMFIATIYRWFEL